MYLSICWPVFELTSDDYDMPKGSLGFFEKSNDYASRWITWLPPESGKSGPMNLEDLKDIQRVLSISHPVIEEMGFFKFTDKESEIVRDSLTIATKQGYDQEVGKEELASIWVKMHGGRESDR